MDSGVSRNPVDCLQVDWSSQGGGQGSQHTTLAPADARMLIAKGWAEWHPVAHANCPLVLVYAPRDAQELELCLQAAPESGQNRVCQNSFEHHQDTVHGAAQKY